MDNILVNYDSEEDRKKQNLLKAKVKIIDLGFARHLNPSQLAYSILGSPINMDPGILRKLNKMENSRNYGYDQKADIWSLGTICYEMLIGKCTFDAENMRELINKVERGNYYLPTNISKEAVSFLNGMLQYDFKKRLSAEQLNNHKFLTKPYSELTKINLKDANRIMAGSQMKINSKKNQSIWAIFEEDEELCEVGNEEIKIQEKRPDPVPIPVPIPKPVDDDEVKKIDDKAIKAEFLAAFESMNDDFIYIEPQLIPIIPGDDPTVINKVSEFSEDNF